MVWCFALIVPTIESDKKTGKIVGYVYYGATLAWIFSLSDSCRTGVPEAIKELKSLGIRAAMLTGDSEAAAMYVQEQLDHALEVVHAELLPEGKATIIKELKKEGPITMTGDDLNDALVLAIANIGISMGISGSALAIDTGHLFHLPNDLRKVPKTPIRLARKAHRKVIENVIMSMSTKSDILALAFASHPLVWAAVLANVHGVHINMVIRIHRIIITVTVALSKKSRRCNVGLKNIVLARELRSYASGGCSNMKVEKMQGGAQNSSCSSGCCSIP
ncbi:hypothetical protein Peur_021030 [Populus x canadensis]